MKVLRVDPDGTAVCDDIDSKLLAAGIYSRAIPLRLSASIDESPEHTTFSRIDYRYRGRMLDDTPIFCAPGWDVREAYAAVLSTRRQEDMDRADSEMERAVYRLMGRGETRLDGFRGEAPADLYEFFPISHDAARAQGLSRRHARLILAARTK